MTTAPAPGGAFSRILSARDERGTAFLLLLDPDQHDARSLAITAAFATECGVDGFLVGGSLLLSNQLEADVLAVKSATDRPVVLFPGAVTHITSAADAILYLSLISGRNPDLLFGNHVVAAPLIKRAGLEAISTGYMLIESGRPTSASFMSGTHPIPRDKPAIAVAHALAAELMGMRCLYLEAGSGALHPVPVPMVRAVAASTALPVMVGGGLKTADEIAERAAAGAAVVVVGNAVEARPDPSYLRDLVAAAHHRTADQPAQPVHR